MTPTRAAQPPGQPNRRRRLLGVIRLHRGGRIDEEGLTSAILGTVVGLSAMVAAGAHGTLGEVEVIVLVTVAIYWAADCYARLLAAHGAGRRAKVSTVMRREWPMVEASYTPLLVLLVVVLITENLRVGIFAALGVGTLVLGGLGFFAARRAGGGRADALKWSLVSAGLGIIVISLKLLLH
ncbi:MAG: hypothetical protein J2P19_23135 [Pseudonocardia sp.]|nr:hypothetical protein [Pseudonocardia sp.]